MVHKAFGTMSPWFNYRQDGELSAAPLRTGANTVFIKVDTQGHGLFPNVDKYFGEG